MSKFNNVIDSVVVDERSEERLIREAEQFRTERYAIRLDRLKLITNLSIAAGAAGMLGVAGCSSAGPAAVQPATSAPTVLDVLNFALNLEYFEANYYSYIVTGSGIPASMMGTSPGTVSGGAKVSFQYSSIANIAANLMTEEVQHVQDLITTITAVFGATAPISMPDINLAPNPALAVNSDATFVAVSRAIEATGVSAYAGGAQYLVSNTTALTYAAQILDTEAQHEGALRQACIYFPSGTAVASPAVDALDMPPTPSQIFNTGNTNGLNPVRTISQVLDIVYAPGSPAPAAGTAKGGYFPSGFKGNIFST